MQESNKKIGIIGAGPAGLTAAYQLAKAGVSVIVHEKDAQYVGGISRTEKYKGFHFDIGGHRFFSKSKEVEDFWTEILGDDLINRPRKSRIYYGGKFYSYPLKAFEALGNLGILTSAQCMLSYLQAKIAPIKNVTNFEQWVSNAFGKKLFGIFFKTYTEKVWGMPCHEISADWAAQRIKGLSLGSAIYNALFSNSNKNKGDKTIKTLIDTFRYPRKGPGMMWERCVEKTEALGGKVLMNQNITSITQINNTWELQFADGTNVVYDYLISTMPLRELMQQLQKQIPSASVAAATSLQYRDFLTVVLMLEDENKFDDNWIYIHDSKVQVGRVQNFKSWSPEMVPDAKYACYGLEYFCFEGDGLWSMSNEDLIALAKKEMAQLGLINVEKVFDGYVVRQPKAYPVYNEAYQNNMQAIKKGLEQVQNLYVCGRNGMHKYNNQDHSMMTAMLAAKNIIAGENIFDLWNVNEDAEYHESGDAGAESFDAGRSVPKGV
jgi:protoporphyrinogen oxidase